jgi:hypothetical protein
MQETVHILGDGLLPHLHACIQVVCARARVMFSGRSSFHVRAQAEATRSKECHPKDKNIANFTVTEKIEI